MKNLTMIDFHAVGIAALATAKKENYFPAFLRGRGDSNPVTIAKRRKKRKAERQRKKINR